MVNLTIGILIGVTGTALVARESKNAQIKWYGWALFVLAALAAAFAFDMLLGSFIEHEYQAAWIGFGTSIFAAVVLALAGHRWGILVKQD